MKVLFAFLVAVLMPFSSFACAMEEESDALDLRALQSNMMVAALSCDQQKNYNKFMSKYQDRLIDGGDEIKSYFKRTYGFGYEQELNRFVTNLANKATERSMKKNASTYCQQMDAMFKNLLSLEEEMLADFVEEKHFANMHGVNSCS